MYRRKRVGRTLELIAAPFTLFGFWLVAIYTSWFMHSEGTKSPCGVGVEELLDLPQSAQWASSRQQVLQYLLNPLYVYVK